MKFPASFLPTLALLPLSLPAHSAPAPLHAVRVSLTVLADARGMTAYAFSLDESGTSRCTGRCAELWPPIAAPQGELVAPYSAFTRADGFRQLQYEGKPVYLWI
jgi:predicted lipoprotein with Yx(FWY)xxD motif